MTDNSVLHFDDKNILLENSGGKGVNLAKLYQSGFQVPSGFIVTTNFYDKFVETHNLRNWINEKLLIIVFKIVIFGTFSFKHIIIGRK